MAAARELAIHKLDLVGVQEVRWDKPIVRCVWGRVFQNTEVGLLDFQPQSDPF
jgi:hypothetical protein